MSNFVVVSYYTKKTPYETVMKEHLGKSLGQYDIPYLIYSLESEGSWMKNVALKPHVILMAMRECPKKNIVFLDADAVINAYPKLFEEIPEEYDMAAHYLDWETWYRNGSKKHELLSGTLLFRNTDKLRALVVRWYNDALQTGEWEQKCLQRIIEQEPGAINVYQLPLEYCYIHTLPDGSPPHVVVEHPIIVHHQVSRQLKRLVS